MQTSLTAIEMTGRIDEHHQLQLDETLPLAGPVRVRVIVLYPVEDEFGEAQWLQAAVRNPVFDFLSDPAEDIYSLTDGKPFDDEV